jgi:hypothetical protein
MSHLGEVGVSVEGEQEKRLQVEVELLEKGRPSTEISRGKTRTPATVSYR